MTPYEVTMRTRFAWLPVRLWEGYQDERGNYWVRPTLRFIWLKHVRETNTLAGWTAYKHHQELIDGSTKA